MKNKKPTTGYCSQYLCCIKAQTFQDIVKELNELAEKHSTDDFDEVVITGFFGTKLYFPNKMPTLYFSQVFFKEVSNARQQQEVIL